MRIVSVAAYQVDLPLREGRYTWADGRFVEVFDSTVVEIRTDDGLVGYGEVCPLGAAYLPAYAGGARVGGRMSAGSAPGLGVVPDPAVLGEAVFTVR